MILPQHISVTPHGPKSKYSSICSIFHKLSGYCNLEITIWGKRVIGDLKDYYLLETVSQIFVKKNLRFLPQNAQTVFELSVMNIYIMYYEKLSYNI
jgi:hypothetical protein